MHPLLHQLLALRAGQLKAIAAGIGAGYSSIARSYDGTYSAQRQELVAIADPTAYVAEGSELDKEAAQRAFTVYMPGRNVPMIPRTLSDELCSLKEGEERNTLCARLP